MSEFGKHPLIERLESMANEASPDRGNLARLRRALQDPVEAYPVILPYMRPDAGAREVDMYAALAALFAIHPKTSHGRNFGEHMKLAAGENIEATERRFTNLLRANAEDLPVLLRQAVSFLRSKEIAVNWEQLRKDLLAWNHADRYVQKQWARRFWGNQNTDDEKGEN
jgi:CRISPR system Cascade subunit CasB